MGFQCLEIGEEASFVCAGLSLSLNFALSPNPTPHTHLRHTHTHLNTYLNIPPHSPQELKSRISKTLSNLMIIFPAKQTMNAVHLTLFMILSLKSFASSVQRERKKTFIVCTKYWKDLGELISN